MTDWVTISSLATGGGTLVLAVATYASVRSANRSARLAEQTLLAGMRPVLVPSRDDDPPEHVRFGEGVVLTVPGHGAAVQRKHDVIYMAIALRNGGTGLAVLHGWRARPQPPRDERTSGRSLLGEPARNRETPVNEVPDTDRFRRQQLDLYIPAGETGFWQGAMRDRDEPGYDEVRRAVDAREGLWVELLYGDYEGGQRTIVRLAVSEWPDTDGERVQVLRYFNLDREDPR